MLGDTLNAKLFTLNSTLFQSLDIDNNIIIVTYHQLIRVQKNFWKRLAETFHNLIFFKGLLGIIPNLAKHC